MFERGYFEVFEGDDPELRKVLNQLATETERHTGSLRNALAKKRWKLF
jgi:rubrerythrin